MTLRLRAACLIAVAFWLMFAGDAFAQAQTGSPPKDGTETVYTTFHVIAGKEDEFWKVLERAWPTYYKHGMVLKRPHLILRGADDSGRPYFIEILTWKDHDAPVTCSPK